MMEQLNGYLQQIARIKEQMLGNLQKAQQLQKEQSLASEIQNSTSQPVVAQTQREITLFPETGTVFAQERTSAKAHEKETVGAVQMQFLREL